MTPSPLHQTLATIADLRRQLQEQAQHHAQARQEREQASQRWREEQRQESKQHLAQLQQRKEQLNNRHQDQRQKLEAEYRSRLESLTAQYRRQREQQWGKGPQEQDPQSEEQLAAQASAKATTRYNTFRRKCDELDKQLLAFLNRIAGFAKPIAATAITLPKAIDPEGHLEDLQRLSQETQQRLTPLLALGPRLRLAPLTHLMGQLALLILAAVIAWQVWNHSQDGMAPLIVAVVWLVLALIVLAVRETAAATRRKAFGLLMGEGEELRAALHTLRKRGSAKLDPQQALAKALDTLERQHSQRQQAAAEEAAAEERQLALARQERDRASTQLQQERDRALTQLQESQSQAIAALDNEAEAITRALAGQGTCPQLEALIAPYRQSETAALERRDALLQELAQCCARMQEDATASLDAATVRSPAQDVPKYLPMGSLRCSSSHLLQEDGWTDIPATELPLELPVNLSWDLAAPLLLRANGQQLRPLLHQTVLQVMASVPTGMVRFTLCDPQHLGEHFAPFLSLCDQHSHLLGPKVWTSTSEIEQRLHDLSEHGEKVIQKYLRDRHPTLADYNRQAGALAEPYQVLVLCDLPRGCSSTALERLNNLLHFGPRCGISVWLHCPGEWPKALSREVIHEHGLIVDMTASSEATPAHIDHPAIADWSWQAPAAPEAEALRQAVSHIHAWQQQLANRAIPIEHSFPAHGGEWQDESSTLLRIAIGRSGADAYQYLELGRGTAQHVLIGGRTGSGKSTLLHAMILSGAMAYSPEQLQFYLVDFKKGVEFKSYARHKLPHARVVAVESDREYGLSVLRTLDEELDRRGQLFRAQDVQDLAGFRQAQSATSMPRICLVIDEFHEFFVEDDAIARDAAVLLERFVRQGRAFGMHIILGSQSISGSMSLARSAIGQIGVRIALQCNESDSQLILSEDNPAARLLDRPGEAIYNGAAGQASANSPFQVFWVDDQLREASLKRLRALAPDAPEPWSFEGNVPALLSNNLSLRQALQQGRTSADEPQLRGWLGEPNALKGPCELHLQRRSGGHCLIVGQHRPGVYGSLAGLLAGLAVHHPGLEIHCVDGERGDERGLQRLQQLASQLGLDWHSVSPGESAELISSSAAALDGGSPSPERLIILLGLNRLRALRQEDSFAFDPDPKHPGVALATCLEQGPERGTHLIAWCESAQQVNQCLNRSSLRWFNHRLLFQMNAGDSTELIDDSGASRLGLNHALLCDLDSMAREKFRPYAALDDSLLNQIIAWHNASDKS